MRIGDPNGTATTEALDQRWKTWSRSQKPIDDSHASSNESDNVVKAICGKLNQQNVSRCTAEISCLTPWMAPLVM